MLYGNYCYIIIENFPWKFSPCTERNETFSWKCTCIKSVDVRAEICLNSRNKKCENNGLSELRSRVRYFCTLLLTVDSTNLAFPKAKRSRGGLTISLRTPTVIDLQALSPFSFSLFLPRHRDVRASKFFSHRLIVAVVAVRGAKKLRSTSQERPFGGARTLLSQKFRLKRIGGKEASESVLWKSVIERKRWKSLRSIWASWMKRFAYSSSLHRFKLPSHPSLVSALTGLVSTQKSTFTR